MDTTPTIASESFPYVSAEFRVGDFAMRYLDESTATDGSGFTLLCVHGNPTWSFYYRRIVEQFRTRHRVIAVDHIGCGRSDKPSRNAFGYRMAHHRDNLIALIDHLGLRNVILVAHDWGGAIGLSAMASRLDRLSGVVLLNTAAFPPPYMPRRIAACRWPLVGTPAVRGLNLFARAAVTMAMSRTKMTAATASGLLAPYDSWDHRVAIDAFVRDIPLSNDHPTMATLRELESSLPAFEHTPIELIWGMKDWCFREECLSRFESVWPHANSHRLETTGHYVMEDSPEETIEILQAFLSRVSAATPA
ncbi:MAG: alpha/beta fold hydrolase [Planctomycetota bacterium]